MCFFCVCGFFLPFHLTAKEENNHLLESTCRPQRRRFRSLLSLRCIVLHCQRYEKHQQPIESPARVLLLSQGRRRGDWIECVRFGRRSILPAFMSTAKTQSPNWIVWLSQTKGTRLQTLLRYDANYYYYYYWEFLVMTFAVHMWINKQKQTT